MDREITCPAGEPLGGGGCRCHIERNNIEPHHSPRSLWRFCTDAYDLCPTWRKAKDAYWADQHRELDRELERNT